ncbi:MAG: hypothetical protein D6701_03760 [Gemmatimonadetes bacterium]|nr:MAG: hypothetical protein D6701_03760 [Gemmatimonadota bacterium]
MNRRTHGSAIGRAAARRPARRHGGALRGPALALLTALVIGPAAAAAAQEPTEGPTRAERLRRAYPEAAVEQIEQVIAEAARQGLPAEPLYDKALEGAAKRIPPPRVVGALRDYAGRLARARELMGGTPQTSWIVAGADALRRGVAPDAVRAVGERAGERTPMALVVMGDLVEAGVPADRAVEVLREALQRTRTEEGLLDVPAALRRMVRDGVLPPDAARRMLRAMRDGVPVDRIHRRPGGGVPDRVKGRPVPPGSEPSRLRPRDQAGSGDRSGSTRPSGGARRPGG